MPRSASCASRWNACRNKKLPPRPLWLAWIGGPLPADLSVLWRWYLRRFTVEHAFRFFKQTLGWTTVRPRHPAAADRWTCLVAAACWQLWLARPLLSDVRLPWEHPRSDRLPTPGQVQRHFTRLLVRVGTPARAPRPARKIARSPRRTTSRCLHSTTKWRAALLRVPLDLSKLVQTSML